MTDKEQEDDKEQEKTRKEYLELAEQLAPLLKTSWDAVTKTAWDALAPLNDVLNAAGLIDLDDYGLMAAILVPGAGMFVGSRHGRNDRRSPSEGRDYVEDAIELIRLASIAHARKEVRMAFEEMFDHRGELEENEERLAHRRHWSQFEQLREAGANVILLEEQAEEEQ
jgi:hypothetical protein